MNRISCLLMFCCFSLVATQLHADFFIDDFDSGADAQWGNEVGGWTDAGGTYQATAPNNLPNAYSALSFQLTDFEVEFDINNIADGGVWLRSSVAAGTNVGRTGVLLVTGPNGGLYWHDVVDGNTYGGAQNVVNGLFTVGVSDPHLRVVVEGDDYSVFVDGAAIAATSLTTNSFSVGEVALYDNSSQTFDNFSIAVPEPTSGAILGISALGLFIRRRRKA